jgi:hypothetical protein
MDEETKFQVFILQKPAPRLDVKPTGNVVKDGLHMIFSIAIEQVYHLYLRDQVVEEIGMIEKNETLDNTIRFIDDQMKIVSDSLNYYQELVNDIR